MSTIENLTDEELVTQFYNKARALAKKDKKLKVTTYTLLDCNDSTKEYKFHARGCYDYFIQFHDTIESELDNDLRIFIRDYRIKTLDELVVSYVEYFMDMVSQF